MPDWKKSMQQTFEYYIVDPRGQLYGAEGGSAR